MPGIIVPLILAVLATPVIVFLIMKNKKNGSHDLEPKTDNDLEYLEYLEKTGPEVIELINKSIKERLCDRPFNSQEYKELLYALIEIVFYTPYQDAHMVNDGIFDIPELEELDGKFYRNVIEGSRGVFQGIKKTFDSENKERLLNGAEEELTHIYQSDLDFENFIANSSFEVEESKDYLTALPMLRAFKFFASAQLSFNEKLKEKKKWDLERKNSQLGYSTMYKTIESLAKVIKYGIIQRFSESNRDRVEMKFVLGRISEAKGRTTYEEFYNFESPSKGVTAFYKILDWILTKNPDYRLNTFFNLSDVVFTFRLRDNDKNNFGGEMPLERVFEVDGAKELLSNPRSLLSNDFEYSRQIKEFKKEWEKQFEEFDNQKRAKELQADEETLKWRRDNAIDKIREEAQMVLPAGGVNVYLVEYSFGYEDRLHRYKCFFSDSMEEVKQQFVKFFRKAYTGHEDWEDATRFDKHIIDKFIANITCINYMFK